MDFRESSYRYMRVHQLRRWHHAVALKGQESLYYGQLPFLEYIFRHPGCNQKDISDRFALSRAAVTKSIKRMLKNGVITREVSETDERKYKLFITEKGLKLTEDSRKVFYEVDQLTFKGFSEEEMQLFDSFLNRMDENLETDYSRNKSPRILMAEIQDMEKEAND